MRLVIADTGPLNYLILIEHIDLLPALFERVLRLSRHAPRPLPRHVPVQ